VWTSVLFDLGLLVFVMENLSGSPYLNLSGTGGGSASQLMRLTAIVLMSSLKRIAALLSVN